MDQHRRISPPQHLGNNVEQSSPFRVARVAQSSSNGIQVPVVIAGMAAKLEDTIGSRRDGLQHLPQRSRIEVAGGRNADRSIGRKYPAMA